MDRIVNKVFGLLKGDKVIWLVVLGLAVFSSLAVLSATEWASQKASGSQYFFALKHIIILLLGLVVMYFSHLVDYKYYSRIAQIFLWLSIPLLLYTIFFGSNINDAKRWITLPVINRTFQTSDFAKLALIMYTARVLSKKQNVIKSFKEAFVPVILPIVVICALIAPADLSTAALLFVTCLILMFIGRVSFKHILATIGTGVASLALMIGILAISPEKGRLETWQNRIEDFAKDKDGPYQIQQAKIAVIKGGMVRLAPGKSTQRNYLPHPYSDFIYALIIEEYGLAGGIIILALYLLLLLRTIRIVAMAPRAFGALLAVGLAFSLVVQALINMGVNVHLLPVTGLTLPMVSMGGSSIWFTGLALGIILAVSRNVEEFRMQKLAMAHE